MKKKTTPIEIEIATIKDKSTNYYNSEENKLNEVLANSANFKWAHVKQLPDVNISLLDQMQAEILIGRYDKESPDGKILVNDVLPKDTQTSDLSQLNHKLRLGDWKSISGETQELTQADIYNMIYSKFANKSLTSKDIENLNTVFQGYKALGLKPSDSVAFKAITNHAQKLHNAIKHTEPANLSLDILKEYSQLTYFIFRTDSDSKDNIQSMHEARELYKANLLALNESEEL